MVLAPGSTSRVLPIPGLADVPYLTNESIFELDERPEHLLVLGGNFGGLTAALAVQHELHGDVDVTVVSASA